MMTNRLKLCQCLRCTQKLLQRIKHSWTQESDQDPSRLTIRLRLSQISLIQHMLHQIYKINPIHRQRFPNYRITLPNLRLQSQTFKTKFYRLRISILCRVPIRPLLSHHSKINSTSSFLKTKKKKMLIKIAQMKLKTSTISTRIDNHLAKVSQKKIYDKITVEELFSSNYRLNKYYNILHTA